MVAMFVSEEDAIKPVGRDSALGQAQDELSRAQSAIDQKPAMVGCDKRAVSCAPAAEHRQREHVRLVADATGILKQKRFPAAKNLFRASPLRCDDCACTISG